VIPGAVAGALVLVAAGMFRGALRARRRVVIALRLPAPGASPARPGPRGDWRAPVWLPGALAACGVGVDPSRAWRGWLTATALGVGAALVAGGPGAAVVAALVALAGPAVAWRLSRHRGDARLEAELPSAMDAVARGLRSGGSLRQALAEAAAAAGTAGGTLATDLRAVARATGHGATVVAALEAWAARRPRPGVRLAVAALCLGAETGGAGARAVDGVAATLRVRQATLAEARALATQARVSAVVIGVAPLAFCALAAATDDRTADFLLRSPAGLAMLLAGLSLDALGALWMARLTRIPT